MNMDMSQPIRVEKKVMVLTDEQEAILAHEPTSTLVVEAGAGTGKTSTLIEYSKKWRQYRGLYIAFNKAIADEAQRRFPPHIRATTAHAYAFKALNVGNHSKRLVGKIRRQHIREAGINCYNSYMSEDRLMKAIISGLENFTNDAGKALLPHHCGLEHSPKIVQDKVMPVIAQAIQKFLNYDKSSLPFTHDCYLKRLEMYGQMGAEFDYIMVDEAQDLSPVLLSLVERSGKPIIAVGDPKQSIYAFRKAIDAMTKIEGPRLPLSQSWRFGAPVDALANHILTYPRVKPTWPIRGRPGHTTKIELYSGKSPPRSFILSRTNARLFQGLVGIDVPFHVAGGFETIASQLLSALALSQDRRRDVKDSLIQQFATWEAMVEEGESDDMEIKRLVKIVTDYGNEIPIIIERLRKKHCPKAADATIVLSTAHKAKGLEADTVIILDDFPTPAELQARRIEQKISAVDYDQEFHLAYVAVTRAMDRLLLSANLWDAYSDAIHLPPENKP